MSKDERCLGFYSLNETKSDDGYLGALLITDQLGRPLEFRVTYPVKPSAFQRPLYGDTLQPYIGTELCGKQLLRNPDHTPEILLVSADILLGVRDFVAYPVVYVKRAGDSIEVDVEGLGRPGLAKQDVHSPSGRFQPVTIRTTPAHEDDLARALTLLEEAFSSVDLVEPFQRIAQAVDRLATEDARFA